MGNDENSWGSIVSEFNKVVEESRARATQPGLPISLNLDPITQKYIDALVQKTQRPMLIYAVDFFNAQKAAIAGNDISIVISDKDGIVETTRKIPPGPLDIIIHSPGGSLEATESIVDILRQKFTDIRFFIPNTAKSAATMWALSGDEVYLASSAELGPIDPQIISRNDRGMISQSAAQAIIDQFEAAQKDLSEHPNRLPAWIPILPMYGPSLYHDSKLAIKLSKEIVRGWLVEYMFKGLPKKKDRINKAVRVVNYFANHKKFKSHGRKIGLTEIEKNLKGLLKIKRLDDDQELYNSVMGVYYCLLQIFQYSPVAFKVIQNNIGQRYIRNISMPTPQFIQMPGIPRGLISPQ
jgi:hypothetical protein